MRLCPAISYKMVNTNLHQNVVPKHDPEREKNATIRKIAVKESVHFIVSFAMSLWSRITKKPD